MNRQGLLFSLLIIVIFAAGTFFRVYPSMRHQRPGFDETVYVGYVGALRTIGASNYGAMVKAYQSNQDEIATAVAHPLRVCFILGAYFWMLTFGCEPATALHGVSAAAGVACLAVAGIFAWRAGGRGTLAGVLALMACAPLQILLSQRALVDGVFGFWAIVCFWLLWENLRAPNHAVWLPAFGASLCLLVLAKEFAVFVVFAFVVLLLLNRWLHFGTVTPALAGTIVLGPLLGVMILVWLAGSVSDFIHIYASFVAKSRALDYSIRYQDGPWTRYILDFLLVTPLVTLLAIGRLFQLSTKSRPELYCALFLLASFVPMANLSGGMNLRFAACWDLPLCFLAFSQLDLVARRLPPRRGMIALVVSTALVCGVELNEYCRIFVKTDAYDPITPQLLRSENILK